MKRAKTLRTKSLALLTVFQGKAVKLQSGSKALKIRPLYMLLTF